VNESEISKEQDDSEGSRTNALNSKSDPPRREIHGTIGEMMTALTNEIIGE
jgi:hypothetical protein